ncbi:hypothetical protein GJU43_01500 [Flavobacterium sp. LC2016-23]|uniref:hypothetical protein n=1 Tax=Flavobacterium sp. LC2016-23 TaxID=2666330 RepID=UPI0012AEE323|nr:hypothetical protein [Flavobacterium sp. LC2016-23]MRX37939.1 hypothetical protein [Flavobacterium sp. LC2016-23]
MILKKTRDSPGNMIANFTNDPWNSTRFNWTVKSGGISCDGPPAGQTLSLYIVATGVTTAFNSFTYTDSTDLSWARTMLYESIHAYLITCYIRNPRGLVADYPVMFQEWIADSNKGLNNPQHEEISRSFVKSFGDAFEVYLITKGYNLDKQFYQDMAWGGLEETDAFKNLSEADRKRISNVIQVELHGTNMNGNPKPQKGKKAGC